MQMATAVNAADGWLTCTSPDGNVSIGFASDADGMHWRLTRNGQTLVASSRLGLSFSIFKGNGRELGAMRVIGQTSLSSDTTWTNRLYRRETVRDRFNELEVSLEEAVEPHRRIGLVFRAYDEGAAFRYVIPEQEGVEGFELLREQTEWRFPGKCRGWFTSYPGHFNSNEKHFLPRELGDISRDEFIGMPATVEVAGQWVAICEAALVNWAGFYLKTPEGGQPADASMFETCLSPLPSSNAATDGAAVIRTTPAACPRRSRRATDSRPASCG